MKERLAIEGGAPVRKTLLPYGRHAVSDEDIAAVVATLKGDWITQGPTVESFERAVADYGGASYAVAFSSGTAALHAACAAAGLGPGDEAITTPLTFVATANAAVYCGARPVFADIYPDTLNIDVAEVERRIGPRTKAVLPVDFGGQPVDLESLMALAQKHHLVVIEDACHAFGAGYHGRRVGGISHITVFSFHPVKHITTAEGGMALTNDKALADTMRRLRHHGIVQPDAEHPWLYEVPLLGFNYRLTDIQCALGLSQLRRVDLQLARRREIAARYQAELGGLETLSLPVVCADVEHAWHIFVVLLRLERLAVDRDAVVKALRAENIGVTLHYPLVHLHPLYRKRFGYGEGTCPVAEGIGPRLMTLPLFPAMRDGDVGDVIHAVKKVLGRYQRSASPAGSGVRSKSGS